MIDLKSFREERNVAACDIVAVMREQYPGYDKTLQSKVERPDRYGIRLVNDAERLINEAFAKTAQEARRRDNRRLKARIQCRMTKTELERLQHALNADGYDTIQAGLTAIIKKYLEDRKDV